MANSYPGIWRAIASAESYNKGDVTLNYKVCRELYTPEDIVRWVKQCGENATTAAAALDDRGANCIAEMVLTGKLCMLPSLEVWEGFLRKHGMLDHELLCMDAMRRTVHYLLDVYEGGNVIGPDRIELAASIVRATQLFDPDEYAHLTKDGGRFTELCQRLLDSLEAKDKAMADDAFSKNYLDLYALAREPRPSE